MSSSSAFSYDAQTAGHTDWRPALSASRAKEYQRCPLQYRLHVVDGLTDPPSKATTLGTLVHAVLEHLFEVPAPQRTQEYANDLVDPLWKEMQEKKPAVSELFASSDELSSWLDSAYTLLNSYFQVEDPRWLAPASTEEHIVASTPDGIRLRGFIDRIDRAPSGALRVVDYKTGRAPSPRFQDDALFQMRFYALLLQLTHILPARTQLLYLKTGQVLTFDPEPEDMAHFLGDIQRLWERIEADAQRGTFSPRKNPLCRWCGVQSLCPLFGGVTPPLPPERVERLLTTRSQSSSH
ncbi:MAG: recombinase RecB [Actinobacteria bacterium]|nr:MAG: recombinase RecB [Actinomycetota bacterium]